MIRPEAQPDMLAHAMAYAARGWSLLPVWPAFGAACTCPEDSFSRDPRTGACKSPGKHPINSRGLSEATCDPAQVRAWWAAHPNASIAIAMVRSGLLALDIDGYHQDQVKVDALESALGALPNTLTQLSGSGDGWHLIFRAPMFPVVGVIGGVVTRSKSYLVVAPSLHVSGGHYQWLDDRPPVDLPPAWLEALRRPVSASSAGVPAEADEADWLRAIAAPARLEAARAHLRREPGEVRGASRAGECFNVCRSVARGYALRDPSAALDLVLAEYNPRCRPPYAPEDVARRVVAAYDEAELPEWGALLRPHDQVLGEALKSIGLAPRPPGDPPAHRADAAPNAPPAWLPSAAAVAASAGEDPGEVYAGEMLRALDEVQAALGAAGDQATVPAPLFEPAGGLFAKAFLPTPWLVRHLIVDKGVAAIATEPKSAKTWLATEVAVAVATGTRVCGEFETGAPRRVAYHYAEDLGDQVRNKVRSLCSSRGVDPVNGTGMLFVQPRGRHLDLTRAADVALIVASCRMIGGVDLLVLDPLRDVHSGEEDSSDAMAKVMRAMRVIADLLGAAVLFVHHSAKASADSGKRRGGQRMRGSGAIHGSVDSGVYLSNLTGNGETEFTNDVESETKGARGAGRFTLTLRLEDDEHGAALRATWEVARGAGTKAQQDDSGDEAVVMDRVRALQSRVASGGGGDLMSKNELREVCAPVAKGRADSAISRLLARGDLRYVDGTYVNRHGTISTKTVLATPDHVPAPSPLQRAAAARSATASGPDPALSSIVGRALAQADAPKSPANAGPPSGV